MPKARNAKLPPESEGGGKGGGDTSSMETLKMWMTEVPLRSTWIMRQVMIG